MIRLPHFRRTGTAAPRHRQSASAAPRGGDSDPAVAGEPHVLDRASARLRARRLDRALADGASSERSPATALRARRLIALPRRRSLATTYRRVVREADEGVRPSRFRVAPCRSCVSAGSDQVLTLADRLTQPGPVAARGVAEALLLLVDGTGPLYNCESEQSLLEWVGRATQHLELADV